MPRLEHEKTCNDDFSRVFLFLFNLTWYLAVSEDSEEQAANDHGGVTA